MHQNLKKWLKARCDFDKMIFNAHGDGYKMVVIDGKLYAIYVNPDNYAIFNETAQRLYQEYVSKLIEQELLKEDI